MATEAQSPLFELTKEDREYMPRGTFIPWTEYSDAKKTAMVTSPEKGAFVDVEHRLDSLMLALGSLAHASMMQGLSESVRTPRRQELQERYGSDLQDLISNAEIAERTSRAAARSAFGDAYGYRQMVEYMGDAAQASDQFVDEYDGFQDRYAGAKGNRARDKFRKKLEKLQAKAPERAEVNRAVQKEKAKRLST